MGSSHHQHWLLWQTLVLIVLIDVSYTAKLPDNRKTNNNVQIVRTNKGRVDQGGYEHNTIPEHRNGVAKLIWPRPNSGRPRTKTDTTTEQPETAKSLSFFDKELTKYSSVLFKNSFRGSSLAYNSPLRDVPTQTTTTTAITTTIQPAGKIEKKAVDLYPTTSPILEVRTTSCSDSQTIDLSDISAPKDNDLKNVKSHSWPSSDALKFVSMISKDPSDVSDTMRTLHVNPIRPKGASTLQYTTRNVKHTKANENLTPKVKKWTRGPDRLNVEENSKANGLLRPQSTLSPLKEKLTLKDQLVTQSKHHGDLFRCDKCICSHTFNRMIIANCSKQNYTDIPLLLPTDTWKLNLSKNLIEELNQTSLHRYGSLFTLDVSFNRLRVIRNDSQITLTMNLDLLDLSRNKIKQIEDNAFGSMAVLRNLSLQSNQLTRISNLTFFGLVKLSILDLGNNNLQLIEYGAFDNLPNLQKLSLEKNRHLTYYEKRINPRLFVNLKRLSTLYIQGSSQGTIGYPSKALSTIKNLKTLVIDGLSNHEQFSSEMKTLKNFRSITFGKKNGFCWIAAINKTFFQFTPYLESLELNHCTLCDVDPESFKHLPRLQTLILNTISKYTLDDAFNGLKFLQNSSLHSLSFVHVHTSERPCNSLGAAQAQYLPYINLKVLDLSDNRLSLLGEDFTERLPKTLERLILRLNKFTMPVFLINSDNFFKLKNLKLIDFTFQNIGEHSSIRTQKIQPCHRAEVEKVSGSNAVSSSTMSQQIGNYKCEGAFQHTSLSAQPRSFTRNEKKKLQLPPALKTLLASYYTDFGKVILSKQLKNQSSLEVIDFSHSFLSTWGSERLPRIIRSADLSYNFCKQMLPRFLSSDNRLEKLNIQNNFLGDSFAHDIRGKLLGNANRLIFLDLSQNMLYRLPQKVFKGLNNIQALILNNNRIQMLDIKMAHMKNLNYLDLSANSIMSIRKSTRDDLDEIATNSKEGLRVDLTHNPLPCTCEGVAIIQWLATTKVHIESEDYLQCRLEDGTIEYIGDLPLRAQSLYRACAPIKTIFIAIILMLSVGAVCLTVGLSFRFKWKLLYFKNITLTKFFGHKPKQHTQAGTYAFDAYVVYAEDDADFVLNTCLQELEVKRGHRLCVEERDFLPGSFMATDIICAVQSSAVTMPIVTPDFYTEEYAEYAVKMAVCESIHNKRKTLHLCMYKHVPTEELSADFQLVLRNDHYTEMPPSEEDLSEAARKTFWDNLSKAIGHHSNRSLPPRLYLDNVDGLN